MAFIPRRWDNDRRLKRAVRPNEVPVVQTPATEEIRKANPVVCRLRSYFKVIAETAFVPPHRVPLIPMSSNPVRVVKLQEAPNAQVRSGTWDAHVLGSAMNNESLPVDYELEGVLLRPPAPGETMEILRTKRNGVPRPGIFQSIPIRAVFVVTQNSVYRLEEVGPAAAGSSE